MPKKQASKPDEMLSTKDAAAIAGVNQKTIVRWFDAGLIFGTTTPGGRSVIRRVSRLSLESYLKSLGDQVAT